MMSDKSAYTLQGSTMIITKTGELIVRDLLTLLPTSMLERELKYRGIGNHNSEDWVPCKTCLGCGSVFEAPSDGDTLIKDCPACYGYRLLPRSENTKQPNTTPHIHTDPDLTRRKYNIYHRLLADAKKWKFRPFLDAKHISELNAATTNKLVPFVVFNAMARDAANKAREGMETAKLKTPES